MQVAKFGSNLSDQEYLTVDRECTNFFWGHLPNHETDATNQPLPTSNGVAGKVETEA